MFGNITKDKERKIWPLSIMAVSAIIGIIASLVLSVEAIELAKNAEAQLPCSINSVLNCAAVGLHPTSSIFGFPNAFIGLLTLPVMLTIAVAALMGAKFSRPFMFMAELGAIAGLIFAAWMLLVSYNVIEVLCPWCLTTDVAMLLLFLAITHYNIKEGNLYLTKKTDEWARKFVSNGYDILIGVIITFSIIAAIVIKYGEALWG